MTATRQPCGPSCTPACRAADAELHGARTFAPNPHRRPNRDGCTHRCTEGRDCGGCGCPGCGYGPTAPPARPLLVPADVDHLIDALGALAGIYVERGQPYEPTARLQARLIASRPHLAQALAGLAPVATMVEGPPDWAPDAHLEATYEARSELAD